MPMSRAVLLLVLLAACGSSREGTSDDPTETPADPAPAATQQPLPGIDLASLDDSEKRGFYRIVEGVNSPCGQAMSIARCVREAGSTCGQCSQAAKYVVRLLASGYPVENARELVKLRFAADTRHELSLEGCTWKGNPSAAVTIVEFADFECPHCKLAHEMFDSLFEQTQFASSARLCYRYFPLDGHQNARPAARAAVAATNQGRFWQMHDLVYEHQTELSADKLLAFATELHLDLDRFRADLAAPETDARVQRDRDEGERLEIEGTPTFYVNGRQYGESLDPESIRAYVAEELQTR